MRSCPRGEGEGGGRKRKTEGKKKPPTNGEEGTGETLRALANERRGETEARAKAPRGLSRRCSWADFNSWLPSPPRFLVGRGEGEGGELKVEV